MIKFHTMKQLPLEMHKVRIVQKLQLIPIEERLQAITNAGNNTFLLRNEDVFLDMLTDSGVNAMSDKQQASMLIADDAYAGSATFYRLEQKVKDVLGLPLFLPAHQGRACESILSILFVKPDSIIPMNYHFTTTKSHITINGGEVLELIIEEGLKIDGNHPFKGNIDLVKLREFFQDNAAKVPFVRMEAGTNLIGGQPFSLQNCQELRALCNEFGVKMVLDASLLMDNLYFNKIRESQCKDMSIQEITHKMCQLFDIVYFSARKLGFGRGGGMCFKDIDDYHKVRDLIPLYEGFLTYGGMSVREMEAITVGLDETMDFDVIAQAPQFIAFMVEELQKFGVPVVTPAGGLGCHLDAQGFLPHLSSQDYPAGALASALYLISGIRGMERGTLSEQRQQDGQETFANMELLRLALPRRVFTMSQIKYAVDRIVWLYENRKLVGGLKFIEEPKILRFFFGKLAPSNDWQENLVKKFKEDFHESL